MKRLILFFLTGIAFSCNNQGTASKEANKDSSTTTGTSATTMNYPYTIDHPDYWEIGSTDNTMTVLKSLKAWEQGKMDEAVKYFGDSIHLRFDALDKTMPNDSLKAMFMSSWSDYKTIDVKMHDWESVISNDKKEEWVTIWYTQHWETKKGVKDSASIINDVQLKNGKIVRLDEYTRKLH